MRKYSLVAEILRDRGYDLEAPIHASQAALERAHDPSYVHGVLTSALDRLDGAVDRHIEANATGRNPDEQVQRMAEDRSRLARELDEAVAKSKTLSSVNGEVSRRLVDVMETVRCVLDSDAASGKAR